MLIRRKGPGTTDSRSTDRYRRAILTSIASLLSRGVTVVTAIITVPLVLGYLGTERYGVWLTLSSLVTMLAVADLGVSRSLINHFSRAMGKNDYEEATGLVASAFFSLTGLAIFLVLVFGFAFPLVPWNNLLNVTSPMARAEVEPSILVLFACWIIDWITRLFLRVNEGRQAGYVNNLWEVVGRCFTLGAILHIIDSGVGLPGLVLVLAGVPLLANIANVAYLLNTNRWLIPRPAKYVPALARRILRTGVGFLGLDISYLVIFNGTLLIISNVLGASAVPEFGVPARAFAVINMMTALLVNPLWPAFAEAAARGEYAWIRKAFRRSLVLTICVGLVPTLILIFAGREIFYAWVGDSVVPKMGLLVVLGLWNMVFIIGNTVGVFLNGMGAVRVSATTQVCDAICVVPAQFYVLSQYGIIGAVSALVVCDLVFRTAPRLYYCRVLLKRKTSIASGVCIL